MMARCRSASVTPSSRARRTTSRIAAWGPPRVPGPAPPAPRPPPPPPRGDVPRLDRGPQPQALAHRLVEPRARRVAEDVGEKVDRVDVAVRGRRRPPRE